MQLQIEAIIISISIIFFLFWIVLILSEKSRLASNFENRIIDANNTGSTATEKIFASTGISIREKIEIMQNELKLMIAITGLGMLIIISTLEVVR